MILDIDNDADEQGLKRCFPQGWSVDFVTVDGSAFVIFLVNSSYNPQRGGGG